MVKIRLGLFFGGVSGEHEVSCISAASILKNFDPSKYEVFPVGITKDGRWFLQTEYDIGSARNLSSLAIVEDPPSEISLRPGAGLFTSRGPLPLDIAFLITHGIQGEDGRLQGLLDCIRLPFTGAGVIGSALGMDKVLAKKLWEGQGLPVVPSMTIRLGQLANDFGARNALFEEAQRTLGLPLFVKPANSGSSVGVSKAIDGDSFRKALDGAFAVDDKVLIEAAVDAREVEVAVLGTQNPKAYGPGEIVPSHEFYDYDAKYLDPEGAQLLIPAALSDKQSSEILALAIRAFQALDCQGFARVDFFVDKKSGKVFINEINTLPGFTTISMFPRMVMAGGMSYSEVLDAIVEDARAQFRATGQVRQAVR